MSLCKYGPLFTGKFNHSQLSILSYTETYELFSSLSLKHCACLVHIYVTN